METNLYYVKKEVLGEYFAKSELNDFGIFKKYVLHDNYLPDLVLDMPLGISKAMQFERLTNIYKSMDNFIYTEGIDVEGSGVVPSRVDLGDKVDATLSYYSNLMPFEANFYTYYKNLFNTNYSVYDPYAHNVFDFKGLY